MWRPPLRHPLLSCRSCSRTSGTPWLARSLVPTCCCRGRRPIPAFPPRVSHASVATLQETADPCIKQAGVDLLVKSKLGGQPFFAKDPLTTLWELPSGCPGRAHRAPATISRRVTERRFGVRSGPSPPPDPAISSERDMRRRSPPGDLAVRESCMRPERNHLGDSLDCHSSVIRRPWTDRPCRDAPDLIRGPSGPCPAAQIRTETPSQTAATARTSRTAFNRSCAVSWRDR